MQKPLINVTAAALSHIDKMIQHEKGIAFRMTVKKTGCSGYAYAPQVIQAIHPNDQVIEVEKGHKIYIDTAWLDLLEGITIDFVAEDKQGLKQKRMIITNPKESSRCGCGESFHLKKE